MRTKTSLTLDDSVMPIARARAAADGVSISEWIERAIVHEATRTDVELLEQWERSLGPDDQATLAVLAELDRAAPDLS